MQHEAKIKLIKIKNSYQNHLQVKIPVNVSIDFLNAERVGSQMQVP